MDRSREYAVTVSHFVFVENVNKHSLCRIKSIIILLLNVVYYCYIYWLAMLKDANKIDCELKENK